MAKMLMVFANWVKAIYAAETAEKNAFRAGGLPALRLGIWSMLVT
jgi:hypothetical protein